MGKWGNRRTHRCSAQVTGREIRNWLSPRAAQVRPSPPGARTQPCSSARASRATCQDSDGWRSLRRAPAPALPGQRGRRAVPGAAALAAAVREARSVQPRGCGHWLGRPTLAQPSARSPMALALWPRRSTPQIIPTARLRPPSLPAARDAERRGPEPGF